MQLKNAIKKKENKTEHFAMSCYLYKYFCGLTAVPFTCISKCKWDPVAVPVCPTAAILSPASFIKLMNQK